MGYSLSEKATLNFYQWEYLGRGYHHVNHQVVLEPPFQPFVHYVPSKTDYKDDSRSPNLLQRFGQLLLPSETQKDDTAIPELDIQPNSAEPTPYLVGFAFSFPKGQDISAQVSTEFLDMLAYSYSELSFEIYATHELIRIQIVCSDADSYRVESHLKAYFPDILIKIIDVTDLEFSSNKPIAIADFGLDKEFMLPLASSESFAIDPLTSVIALLEHLQPGDVFLLQILFQGTTAPWQGHIMNAVTDGKGQSFFMNDPHFLDQAIEKVTSPLFSTVVRLAVQGATEYRSQYLTSEFVHSISRISNSSYNQLIPLSNIGYDYEQHVINVFERKSNRLGMLLNTKELAQFIHYPNKSVVSQKLGLQDAKTKLLPEIARHQTYPLGVNHHNGEVHSVSISDESRLRHMHIIGATGVGKSTLLANLILEDMRQGNGCALFDPHGDIVEDILLRIPKERLEDVIIIDPSDTDYPIGFNILSAETEVEKIVLSSDIVSAFKRYATAWGDTMTAVLSNAVNTFLESDTSGTLIELKRFLLEQAFREHFLKSVDDNALHYYWKHEYPMVKSRITPLLTRIDTFLRPKIVRYMLAQQKGIDFKRCIENKRIVLIKLSQGLIGEANSYLLGSLFLSKLNQAAQGRQVLAKTQRHPFYVYLDEFQNFITPSITSILSGARKYGLGLVLAHQELAQIDDPKVLNSVLSNPHTRICFRLGDMDAKRLESGFSYFDGVDLQSLGIGEAIMRIGSANHDYNLKTSPLTEIALDGDDQKASIIVNTRRDYGMPKAEVIEILNKLLPKVSKAKEHKEVIRKTEIDQAITTKTDTSKQNITELQVPETAPKIDTPFEQQTEAYIKREDQKQQQRKHTNLQNFVKKVAQQREYKVTLEQQTKHGGRVDVSLIKQNTKIAVEISVTNSLDYEVKNIKKCLDDGYHTVLMMSENLVHLKNIRMRAQEILSSNVLDAVQFINPLELAGLLDSLVVTKKSSQGQSIRGYKVNTSYSTQPQNNTTSITKLIAKSLQSKKKS